MKMKRLKEMEGMRVLVLATLLSATSSVAAPPGPRAYEPPAEVRATPRVRGLGSGCKDPMRVIPADTNSPPEANRLADLPPGDTILAVYREDEQGCLDPVIVRYGAGRSTAPAREPLGPNARPYR
jgi:hypothetical protein